MRSMIERWNDRIGWLDARLIAASGGLEVEKNEIAPSTEWGKDMMRLECSGENVWQPPLTWEKQNIIIK